MTLCFCERCGKEKEQHRMFNIYMQVCQSCHDEMERQQREYNNMAMSKFLSHNRNCAYCCQSHWSIVYSNQFRVRLCSSCLADLQNMAAGYDQLEEQKS